MYRIRSDGGQTGVAEQSTMIGMTTAVERCIVKIDRFSNSLLILFDDGQCVMYPASLLYAIRGQAEVLPAIDEGDDEDA